MALMAVWAIVLWKLSPDLVMNLFLFAGGLTATGIYRWWITKTHEFAESHPDLALLEGAEFIEYHKWEAEINGLPIPKGLTIPNPAQRLAARKLGEELDG